MKIRLASLSIVQQNLLVVMLWVLFELLWLSVFGTNFTLESKKYIGEADYLLSHHHFSQGRYIFYFTTIAAIAVAFALKLGLYGALSLILIVNLVSYLYFFKALRQLFADAISPYLIIIFLLSFWPYQSWSLYLYTECLFYSGILLLLANLILFKGFTLKFFLTTSLILVFLTLSRPLGILFILPVLLFIYSKLSGKYKIYLVLGSVLFFLLLNAALQVVFTTTPDWSMKRATIEGNVICDMPGPPSKYAFQVTDHPNQLYQLAYYITHNFNHFIDLAFTRLRYFFTMVRTYYSPSHNLYLTVHLIVLYGSILFGLKKIVSTLPKPLLVFIGFSILFFALTIAVQCDDYHNRFFLSLIPLFAVLSSVVLLPVIYRCFSLIRRRG